MSWKLKGSALAFTAFCLLFGSEIVVADEWTLFEDAPHPAVGVCWVSSGEWGDDFVCYNISCQQNRLFHSILSSNEIRYGKMGLVARIDRGPKRTFQMKILPNFKGMNYSVSEQPAQSNYLEALKKGASMSLRWEGASGDFPFPLKGSGKAISDLERKCSS
ncbi:hypothetical protein [uncultured Cohaesibacter sp.]|uniref:hypothetical protein n=1 Tax=uncultured Cohaesibacter sp. TaxID=1002546 RepID=UPI0029C960CF|nr:hypothetical protein [uncultured Cohaesibacter sp.]